MYLKQNSQSLSFIIYGLVALSLLMLYNGFSTLYGNILADFVLREKQNVLLFNMSYGSATALIFIGSLLFFCTRYMTYQLENKGIINVDSAIRYWILGGIVLIASLFAIIDLYTVLSGILTGRSDLVNLLVTLVTLTTVLTIIVFCVSEMKRRKAFPFLSILPLIFIVICIFSVVAGFFIAPPWTGREAHQDQKQIERLQQIKLALESMYYKEKIIPGKLDRLHSKLITNREDILDLVTGQPYEYKKINSSSYELCAHFLTDYDVYRRYRLYPNSLQSEKYHDKGKTCFTDDLSLQKSPVFHED